MTPDQTTAAIDKAFSLLRQPGRTEPVKFSIPNSDGSQTRAAVLDDGSLTRHQVAADGTTRFASFYDAATGDTFDLTEVVLRAQAALATRRTSASPL